jgi:hypothetical protein
MFQWQGNKASRKHSHSKIHSVAAIHIRDYFKKKTQPKKNDLVQGKHNIFVETIHYLVLQIQRYKKVRSIIQAPYGNCNQATV